jgi:hypothetical protein
MIGKKLVRRAYALMLVLIFVALFLAMLGVAWRQMASVLRIEKVRTNQIQRDQGCLLAAVQGIHYLEANSPTDSPITKYFTYTKDANDVKIWDPPSDTPIPNGNPVYKVIFTVDETDPTIWTVTTDLYPES